MSISLETKAAVPLEFDRVSRRYDLLSALNPGYHRHLRLSAERLGAPPQGRILDLCCGTGLSTAALRRAYPDAEITGLDASEGMLERARSKGDLADVRWLLGDALAPEAAGVTGPFDAVLMAYGIRNVPDADASLAKIHTLLAPGGTLCLHEYSVTGSFWARAVWNAVALGIVIPLAILVTRSGRIFRYLRRSVLAFDSRTALEARLRRAGFTRVRTEPMDGWQRGIVHSFLAERPGP